jgi:probable HAF family extracellular repeat protein
MKYLPGLAWFGRIVSKSSHTEVCKSLILLACVSLASSALAQDGVADAEYVGEANVTYTTIDVPGEMNTVLEGINTAGDMVGYYYNGSGGSGTGFLLSGGIFTFLNYPGADLTEAIGINDAGIVSGTAYYAENTASFGFLYDGTKFTRISVAGQAFTEVDGINNSGALAGGYGDFGANTAFEKVGSKLHNVTPPPGGWITAIATGLNNFGEIVGLTTGASTDGFFFNKGKFKTISFPGSYDVTQALGVNDSGLVVGFYESCTPGCALHAFALLNGRYSSLDYPGAMETQAFGVNKAGQVVGTYTLDQQTSHGFVTSPITVEDFDSLTNGYDMGR